MLCKMISIKNISRKEGKLTTFYSKSCTSWNLLLSIISVSKETAVQRKREQVKDDTEMAAVTNLGRRK